MRDLDVSLVADTFTLLRSLRRVLAVSRVIVLVTVLLVLPLMLLATLPWSVTAGVVGGGLVMVVVATTATTPPLRRATRSEEHTSELQSLMRISYAVFCLKKKKKETKN